MSSQQSSTTPSASILPTQLPLDKSMQRSQVVNQESCCSGKASESCLSDSTSSTRKNDEEFYLALGNAVKFMDVM